MHLMLLVPSVIFFRVWTTLLRSLVDALDAGCAHFEFLNHRVALTCML